MRKIVQEWLEANSKEHISPHYWSYLEKLCDIYFKGDMFMRGDAPNVTVVTNISGYSRTTFYLFVKKYYSSVGNFWSIMHSAWLMDKEIRERVENQTLGQASSDKNVKTVGAI